MRWTTVTAPDPPPWHPDEYDITFETLDRKRIVSAGCTVHIVRETGAPLPRKNPLVPTICVNPAECKIRANGVLLPGSFACRSHTLPNLWLPHAHYAGGIRPRRALPLPTHRW